MLELEKDGNLLDPGAPKGIWRASRTLREVGKTTVSLLEILVLRTEPAFAVEITDPEILVANTSFPT